MKRIAVVTSGEHLAAYFAEHPQRDEDAHPPENDITDTWRRVARSAAAVEPEPDLWFERFYEILRDSRFIDIERVTD